MRNRLESTNSLFFLARRKALGNDALVGSYTVKEVEVRDVILPLGVSLLNICAGSDGSLGVSVVTQGNAGFKYGVWMAECGGLSVADEEEVNERLMLGAVFECAGLGKYWYFPNGAPVYNETELVGSTQLANIPYRLGTDVRAMLYACTEGESLPGWYRNEVWLVKTLIRDVAEGLKGFNLERRLIKDLMGESVQSDVDSFLQGMDTIGGVHLGQELRVDQDFVEMVKRLQFNNPRRREIIMANTDV